MVAPSPSVVQFVQSNGGRRRALPARVICVKDDGGLGVSSPSGIRNFTDWARKFPPRVRER